ncbi:Geranylgeranyl pyrophosphate synthase [Daldinia childiae]|uniref:Geranylgeranyl pyrophosphate synthase n=1 Tax=Daldinia childiae TaxID=326645 RepID=UPI0014486FD9|nr:Geranylgeranyl pyrophosphate synthase [Daldinia childiae]KAF3058638.1 Geranylgeranyl pyrophosphate synthase [Daldinia childiae]
MVPNANSSSPISNNSTSLQSPNAIPPRTSSTGYITPLPPVKSVLRPVPDWLGMHATGPQDPARYETEDLNYTSRKTWTEQKEKVLMGPFDYLFAHPGKDFRTLMVNSFNALLEVPQESLDVITKVVGMLHTASLLVDDVEDSSLLRRGLPVAHSIFGTAQTINSANYVYFCALQELQKLKNPKAEEYLEMVGNKTGGLFRLAIKLMQAESATPIDCVPSSIYSAFSQIQDDYRNLSSPEYGQNKGLCEDLTEGKFSFLIIHSIRTNPSNLQLLNILKQRTTDEEVKRYAMKYMESTGSFEYTQKVITILIERARKMTDHLDDGRGKNIGIHKILDKLII